MPYCPKCGVELEQFAASCPLCESTAVEKKVPFIFPYPEIKNEEPEENQLKKEKSKKLLWDIFNFVTIVSFVLILLIDFFLNKNISWSRYPLSSIIFSWIAIISFIFFYKRIFIFSTISIISTSMFLAMLDYFDGSMEWFFIIGLPIIGVLGLLLFTSSIIIKAFGLKGLYIPALFLLLGAIMCCGIDLIITRYLFNEFLFSWSLLVLLASIPPSVLLIFIQRRKGGGMKAHKTIHI